MKHLLSILLLFISMNIIAQEKVLSEDIKMIIGNWQGTITYLDYQSNKPFSMPANLEVKAGKDQFNLILNYMYPNEPKANSSDKIKVDKSGSRINKKEVVSRKVLENDIIEIQTLDDGKDDNKDALIRYTYFIGASSFIIRKEVQFDNNSDWIKRSEYNFLKQ